MIDPSEKCWACDGEGFVPSNNYTQWMGQDIDDVPTKTCPTCVGEKTLFYMGGEQERFDFLAERWERETHFMSAVDQMMRNPCYQEIKKMGAKNFFPLILTKMAHGTTHLMTMLSEAAKKHNPIPREMCGKINEMTMAWIEWAIAKKYVPAELKTIREETVKRETEEYNKGQAKIDARLAKEKK